MKLVFSRNEQKSCAFGRLKTIHFLVCFNDRTCTILCFISIQYLNDGHLGYIFLSEAYILMFAFKIFHHGHNSIQTQNMQNICFSLINNINLWLFKETGKGHIKIFNSRHKPTTMANIVSMSNNWNKIFGHAHHQ